MSDNIAGINIVNPSYPVRPVQPSNADDKSDKRREKMPRKEPESDLEVDDAEDKPVIDEYI